MIFKFLFFYIENSFLHKGVSIAFIIRKPVFGMASCEYNMKFSKDGMLPQTATGSNTTYFCDGLWFNNGQTDYAARGGPCDNSWPVGALCCALDSTPSAAWWNLGAAPSCKPLA